MKLAFPCTFVIGSLLAAFAAATPADASAVGATPDACSPAAPMPKAYVGAGGDCDYHDIQSAIDAAGACGLAINITPETSWTNQIIEVHGNKKIALIGWGSGETCNHLKYCTTVGCTFNQNPRLPITPASGHSGLYVDGSGNAITLTNLEFHGASLGADHGGAGIAFNGSGSLTLDTVTLDNNTAGWGGGIDFSGSGSLAMSNTTISGNTANPYDGGGIYVSPSATTTVTLGTNTIVANNIAQGDGGGIAILGDTHLVAEAPNIWIYYNQAPNGAGGGVFVEGSALADIGSPGYATLPVIDQNRAEYGGGIGLDGGPNTSGLPVVNLYTTDPNNPVSVSGNLATHTGGGIYLKPTSHGVPILCAHDFRIDDNLAQEGSGIYGEFSSYESVVELNFDPAVNCNPLPASSVACAAGVACNEINGNVAETGTGTPTSGATVLMQSEGIFLGSRFAMRGNTGGKALRFLSDGAYGNYAHMDNCLIADNDVTEQVIEMTPGSGNHVHFIINNCTIADNSIGADHVIIAQMGNNDSSFYLTNSIIDQPGLKALDYQGSGTKTINYVLSNDVSTLSGGIGTGAGTPSFVDAAHGDYHLLPTSLGVDYAPPNLGPDHPTHTDLDGKPRLVDLPNPNVFGSMDLGAYEIQLACSTADTIFCDGFDG